MTRLSSPQIEAVKIISSKLKHQQYAIRGTCSLVLQKIEMNVDDIDIICDKETALKTNELFKEYLVESVEYKESPKFKSYFGKFNVCGVVMEVMGDWQIKNKKGEWSQVFDGSSSVEVPFDGEVVRVTPVKDELSMFLLMQRFSAFQKIKKQLDSSSSSPVKLFNVQPMLF